MSTEKILEKLESKLGTDDFICPTKLVEAGIFGSPTAVRNALKRGMFPAVRVSSHRTLIPRDSVVEHLRRSLSVSG